MKPQNMITDKQQFEQTAVKFFNILFEKALEGIYGELLMMGWDYGPMHQADHRGIEDAVRAGQACGAEVIVPIHWGDPHGSEEDIARLQELFPRSVHVLERAG